MPRLLKDEDSNEVGWGRLRLGSASLSTGNSWPKGLSEPVSSSVYGTLIVACL